MGWGPIPESKYIRPQELPVYAYIENLKGFLAEIEETDFSLAIKLALPKKAVGTSGNLKLL